MVNVILNSSSPNTINTNARKNINTIVKTVYCFCLFKTAYTGTIDVQTIPDKAQIAI